MNSRFSTALCGPQVTCASAPRLASLSMNTGTRRRSPNVSWMLMPTHSGRMAPCTTVPVRRSMGPGMPMPAPSSALRSIPPSASRASRRSEAARSPSTALCRGGRLTEASCRTR
jgi:hypothetical protein